MKKKIFPLLLIIFAAILICTLIYTYLEHKKQIEHHEQDSLYSIEAEYYKQEKKIDGAYLYIPPTQDFAIQLPDDADLVDNIEVYDGRLSCNSSCGHLGVSLDEDRLYTEIGEEELKDSYVDMFYGEAKDHKIMYFQTLENENGNEIERSYTITNGEGQPLIYIRELKYNDNIMRVIGQPSDNDTETVKSYVDSFVIL